MVLQHVAEQKQTNQALQETFEKVERAKREWESAVDALPDLVCLIDDQGRLIRANRTIEAWHLGHVQEIKGLEFHELFHHGCADPACYLDAVLKQRAEAQGQLVKQDVYDPILNRHLLVSVCPVTRPNHLATRTAVIVVQDITERKQAEQEREKLIQELDTFAHTVAHDLRNPVGLIMGFAELEGYDDLSNDDLRRFLRLVGQIGHKMNSIIDELLLLAGVRKAQAEVGPLDMAAIVAEAQMRLTHMFQEYDARIILPDTSAWPVALGYAPWVEEIWVNYMSNAVKYGGRPPRLELGATVQADGMVRFWVRDNGPGLTPEEQARMFTPFMRLSQARATGHGLGLSIARRIMDKLGGQVGVESNGVPGLGSVFYFTLPAAVCLPCAATPHLSPAPKASQ